MPVLDVSGRTSRDIPEPQTVNVDPARANAIGIPNATPPVAVLAIPNVAIIFFPNNKLFVGVDILVDIYVLLDGYASVDGYVLVDVGVLIAFVLLRVCRSGDSEPKPSKDGKDNGNFP